jgi:cytochrome c553
VPRLAGMGRDYLTKTIADFRSHARANNPGMSDLMNATSPDDLAALEEYLSGL